MLPHALLVLSIAAIVCAWLRGPWRFAGTVALVAAGLWSGALAPVATLWLAALFATAAWAHSGSRWAWPLFVATALAIGFGLLPGVSPVVLADAAPIKPGGTPYALRLNLGKTLAGVAMLLWLVPLARDRAAWSGWVGKTAPVMAATATAVLLPAWAVGYLHPAPGMPPLPFALTWAAINLLLVCTVEEAFFRGLVQRGLVRIAPAPLAIALAALLFGLAHFAGGWTYALLATVAGVGYGIAYQRSGQRIEAAIIAHFAVNLAHFTLFTYPA